MPAPYTYRRRHVPDNSFLLWDIHGAEKPLSGDYSDSRWVFLVDGDDDLWVEQFPGARLLCAQAVQTPCSL